MTESEAEVEVESVTKEYDLKHAITSLSIQIQLCEARCQNVLIELKNLKEHLPSFTLPSDAGKEHLPSFTPPSDAGDEQNMVYSYHEILCSGTLFAFSKTLPLHLLVECANHKIQTHSEFSVKGQSAMAADYAYKWISTCYPAMKPRIVRDAILIRPYGENPLMSNDGSVVQTRAGVPGMRVAMWKGKNKPLSSNWTKKHDPIWECLTYYLPETIRIGVLHTVLLVTTEEGCRECLDLSIGQFREGELAGMMLYYSEKDGITI